MSTNAAAGTQHQSNARTSATRSIRGVGEAIAANPFAAIAGAAAVSAGLALLLPASRREIELTGDIADKIEEAARGAADSVKEAGRAQVETLAQTALAGIGGAMIEQVVSAGNEGSGAPNGQTQGGDTAGKQGAA